MRAIVLDAANDPWLAQRRRQGLDRFDEVWDGVLHVVPAPGLDHQSFESELEAVLRPLVAAAGLKLLHNFSIYDPASGDRDYRTPDLVVAQPEFLSRRGVEGRAEVVIEILSPNDESRDKVPFYAKHGAREMWIIDPITREIEILILRGPTLFPVMPNDDGSQRAPRLKLTVRTVDGPKLRIEWAGGSAEI